MTYSDLKAQDSPRALLQLDFVLITSSLFFVVLSSFLSTTV